MSYQSPVNKRSTVANKPVNKKTCKHCIRARWLLTVLILASMSVILYLDQVPK
ncbi:MAG: hypothetical protein ACJAYG_001899 [Oceanicoccus sp.]|jgi:hypothetical protein